MRRLLIVFLIFIFCGTVQAQSHILKKQKYIYGADIAGNFSRTGYHLNAAFNLKKGAYQLYLGPKVTLDRLSDSEKTPLGFVAGFRAYPHFYHGHRLDTYLNVDYQLVRWKSTCIRNCGDDKDLIHEYNIGFGFAYKITYKLQINTAIMAGAYTESLYNERRGTREQFWGFNNMLRLGLIYEFNATEKQFK